MSDLDSLRVALVYDRVNKWGGAERVLLALKKIFPKAPLFTAVYNHQTARWAEVFEIKTSFLQKFPFAKKHHEFYPWATPLAFESFSFDEFDIVISVTSAEAKGIVSKPQTMHVCYCLTPTRYLWSGKKAYLQKPGFGLLDFLARPVWRSVSRYLKKWDRVAAQRPDYYLAISENVKKRIKKYYDRDSKVIYPPVDIRRFKGAKAQRHKEKYFLVVSRLVPYKRVDLVVEAFNQLELPLKIVGIGSEMNRLKKIARSNVQFLGKLTEEDLLGYYNSCKAVICPQEEDFGLVPLEAQACGRPVISFRGGGALETIIRGKTGEFFYPQTPETLIKVVKKFKANRYQPEICFKNAQKFSQKKFLKIFRKEIEIKWQKYQKKN